MLMMFLTLISLWSISSAPVQLIIDTDLGFDVDDVGAIAIAHALANEGKVDILGIVCNTGAQSLLNLIAIAKHCFMCHGINGMQRPRRLHCGC
jgi:inosine-uridine nucleoside N-ribohydrolase